MTIPYSIFCKFSVLSLFLFLRSLIFWFVKPYVRGVVRNCSHVRDDFTVNDLLTALCLDVDKLTMTMVCFSLVRRAFHFSSHQARRLLLFRGRSRCFVVSVVVTVVAVSEGCLCRLLRPRPERQGSFSACARQKTGRRFLLVSSSRLSSRPRLFDLTSTCRRVFVLSERKFSKKEWRISSLTTWAPLPYIVMVAERGLLDQF